MTILEFWAILGSPLLLIGLGGAAYWMVSRDRKRILRAQRHR